MLHRGLRAAAVLILPLVAVIAMHGVAAAHAEPAAAHGEAIVTVHGEVAGNHAPMPAHPTVSDAHATAACSSAVVGPSPVGTEAGDGAGHAVVADVDPGALPSGPEPPVPRSSTT